MPLCVTKCDLESCSEESKILMNPSWLYVRMLFYWVIMRPVMAFLCADSSYCTEKEAKLWKEEWESGVGSA